MVVEEAGDRNWVFVVGGALRVHFCNSVVDLPRGARDGFEHGITAESVEICTGESEWELTGNTRE